MLTDTDFLVFAPNPWHGLWRNRQQIFSRLAGPNRVLYVEPGRASLADWRQRRVAAVDLRRPTLVEALPNLWLYRIPPWLPARDTGGLFDRSSDPCWPSISVAPCATLVSAHASPIPHPIPHSALRTPHSHSASPILWLYRPTHWRWAASNFPHSRWCITSPMTTPPLAT